MFGFGPVSSTSISGDPFKLIAVPLLLAGTATLTFTGSARAGIFIPMSGTTGLSFTGSAALSVLQAISGTTSLTFGSSANLRLAGKPIKVSAIPMCFSFRALPESYAAKAVSEQFTFRGGR